MKTKKTGLSARKNYTLPCGECSVVASYIGLMIPPWHNPEAFNPPDPRVYTYHITITITDPALGQPVIVPGFNFYDSTSCTWKGDETGRRVETNTPFRAHLNALKDFIDTAEAGSANDNIDDFAHYQDYDTAATKISAITEHFNIAQRYHTVVSAALPDFDYGANIDAINQIEED